MTEASALRAIALSMLIGGSLLVSPALQANDTLRCGGRLVSLGDDRAQVRAVCGEPALVDPWDAGHTQFPGVPQVIEEWTYNFGSRQLVQVLRFSNDRLRVITTDGYGFSRLPDGNCAPEVITPGMSKFRLLIQCGEPQSTEAFHILAPPRRADGNYDYPGFRMGQVVQVYREHWVYNFGPRLLQRHLTLENGRVVEVREGDRGD